LFYLLLYYIKHTIAKKQAEKKKKQANLQAHKCQETGWEEKKTGKSACPKQTAAGVKKINQSPIHRFFVSFVALDQLAERCVLFKNTEQ
jgi:hypothetical protein